MKKSYFVSAASALLLSGGLLAQTIVTVNGVKIDSKDIDNQVRILQGHDTRLQDSPQLRRRLVENKITAILVEQEAKRLKLDQSDKYMWALQDASSGLLHQAYIAHILEKHQVTENEAKTVYDNYRKFYQDSHEIQLGEILTNNANDAQKAVTALKAKKDFKAVAEQYTINPNGKKNGGINKVYINLKDLEQTAPEVHAAVKSLKKGQYTAKPLTLSNGLYGVFYVNDKRVVKIPTFDVLKDKIIGDLKSERVNKALEALYQKATIQNAK